MANFKEEEGEIEESSEEESSEEEGAAVEEELASDADSGEN